MVCCPFPHQTGNGLTYYESNPSAGINLDKGVFHCLGCGRSFSEVGFIAEVLSCDYETAVRLKSIFDKNDTIDIWKEHAKLPNEIKEKILNLGISEEVIKDLNISSEDGKSISFPVELYGSIMDMRNYNPNSKPKVRSRKGAPAGLILPYHKLADSDNDRWILLCAGEKDMAVARSNGFNAITLTGGENATPLLKAPFKDKKIAIVYDNDNAGIEGAKRVASTLKPIANEVKIVTGFHSICTETGEDITDFFMKYGQTKADLVKYIKETKPFSNEDYEKEIEKSIPTVKLIDASKPENINKTLRANVQVIATNEASYVLPTSIEGTKFAAPSREQDTMVKDEKRYWYLTEKNAKDILHLIDNKFTEAKINSNIRSLLRIPDKESSIKLTRLTKESVFKCSVTDLFEVSTDDSVSIEYNAYVIGKKLDSGKKYRIRFKLVPHPYDGQRLTMLIFDVEEANDSVTNFQLTPENIANLKVIQNIPGSLEEKIDDLTNKARGLTKFNTDATLIQTIDFSYNTVLEFNFKNFKNVRGYLDTILITESRVGKSSTAEALQKTYQLGVFTSLAGSSATVAGIIGGSNKTAGGAFQTRAGLIPQNHKGLIIFEELAKCNAQMLKELTDVKSSQRARITRVNASLDLPASVRMISLTNPRAAHTGAPRPITSYPNGIEILTDLIGTAEDIARFDLMVVQAFRGTSMDPFWEMPEPLPNEVYQTRVRWVWSRKKENVIFEEGLENYIIQQCNQLNQTYDSHIKIFGTEAWKKVSRLAIAVAGYTVSTDASYENIIIKKEHVDYAIDFFTRIYDNETFRLKEYVENERRYETVDEDGIRALEQMYLTFPALLVQLEGSSSSTRAELMAATGLAQDQFAQQLNVLVQQSFIRFQGQLIHPTLRFRKSMTKIDRNTTLFKLGGQKNVPKLPVETLKDKSEEY